MKALLKVWLTAPKPSWGFLFGALVLQDDLRPGLAAQPPLPDRPWVLDPLTRVHPHFVIIKSVVQIVLEKERFSVLPTNRSVQIRRNSSPICRNLLGIICLQFSLAQVELPILRSLEEVELLVSAPEQSSVQVGGNPRSLY